MKASITITPGWDPKYGVSLAVACVATLLAGGYLAMAAVMPEESDKKMNLTEFGMIPVVDRGRVKPFDTWARTTLTSLTHMKAEYTDKDRKTHTANEWALEVMSRGLTAYYELMPVAIPDKEVAAWFGLPANDNGQYELEEVAKGLEGKKAELGQLIRKENRSPLELRVLEVGRQVADRFDTLDQIARQRKKGSSPEDSPLFRIENNEVRGMMGLELRDGLRYSIREMQENKGFQKLGAAAQRAHDREEKDRSEYDNKVLELARDLETYRGLAQLGGVLMVPAADPGEKWTTLGQSLIQGDDNPNAQALVGILKAYATGDVKSFNTEVKRYRQSVAKLMPVEEKKASLEVWFSNFAPFYHCTVLYVIVVVLAVLSWLFFSQPLRWAGISVATLALAVHTFAIVSRMYLQDRPPVTNLYSSAVFIGWGSVLLCLGMELIYRNGLSLAVGGFLGFPTLIIAHYLSLGGDTLEMMQAVLDTNFWLGTHVVCVTLGYMATFVAGFIGWAFIGAGVASSLGDKGGAGARLMTRDLVKTLGHMMYGVVCFALFLSFVGTVLGGIWADQSWGRFWGWDPKENGAVLIVIMNALILHARWAGMIKERGMALLATVGNMVTVWSWFGTNQLGVGLHAYGFNNTLALCCTAFWLTSGAVLTLGLVPLTAWQKGYLDLPRSGTPGR